MVRDYGNIIISKHIRGDMYNTSKLSEELGSWVVDFETRERQKIGEIQRSLSPLEIQILDAVLEQQKQNGTLAVPEEHQKLGWFGLLGTTSKDRRYKHLKEIAEAVPEYRPERPRLFFLPHDFQEASFENFEVLCEGHNTAWNLLTHFGPNPPRGLYLFGGYGTGKTHLISAFSRGLLAELADGYIRRIVDFASGAITGYEQIWNGGRKQVVDEKEKVAQQRKSLEQEAETLVDAHLSQLDAEVAKDWDSRSKERQKFEKASDAFKQKKAEINSIRETEEGLGRQIADYDMSLSQVVKAHLRRAWKAYQFQPTDLAFATFDYLYERRDDKEFITDLLGRKIVVIDDIHPKGDPARMEFIQRIIEYRYNEVRKGATFITSNLSPEQLLLNQNYPKEVAERVHSRLKEMCMPIEFKTDDYRMKIAQKADDELLALAKKLQQEREKP